MPQTVPIGVINGEVILTGRDVGDQMALAHSAYVAFGDDYHVFVGLSSMMDDGSRARYYWYLNWKDEDASMEPFWTVSATKTQMLDYALKRTQSLDANFRKIILATSVDEIIAPPIVFRDMVLTDLPDGRITLVGDAAHPMVPCKLQLTSSQKCYSCFISSRRRRLPGYTR